MNPFDNLNKVLIFEGITGCGKTTQIKRAVSNIENKLGFSVKTADSESDVYSISKEYRNYLNQNNNPLIPYALIHQSTNYLKVQSITHKYDIIIVDRFVLSDLVYLFARSELQTEKINEEKTREQILHPFGIDVLENTITFYIDVDTEKANQRTRLREQTDSFGKKRTYFDSSIQKVARMMYLKELAYAQRNNSFTFITIDGTGEPDDVERCILNKLEETMKK